LTESFHNTTQTPTKQQHTMVHKLILVRHGQSEWNEKNLFTGWVDVRLSAKGEQEAARAGELLKESGIKPDVLYTSLLSRAIQTANIALDKADRLSIPVVRSWRLNERHYGALQGKDKAETLEKYGAEKFQEWRRSFDIPPPPIEDDSKFSQFGEERYNNVDPNVLPKTESLALVIDRLLPYWQDTIARDILDNKTVIIAAHGNSLRALVKHLDNISDDEIAGLNIPTGIPLVYELDDQLKPTKPAYYLDPEAAAAGAAAVAAQGQKK
jgi:2,3-bisphosphoglycerate-dependent phosphoglycerate mutase